MNKILGIIGRQGSCKSTLAKLLTDTYDNYVYLDVDEVVRNIYKRPEVVDDFCTHYGYEIVSYNRDAYYSAYIDTKKLGKIVINNEKEMDWLNDYINPLIDAEIENFINNQNNKIIVIHWALLPATKLIQKCDVIWQLNIPYEIRKERVLLRDNITAEYFDKREARYPAFAYDFTAKFVEFDQEALNNLKISIKQGNKNIL